jgi:hypothetical protein
MIKNTETIEEPDNWGQYYYRYTFLMFDYKTVGVFSGGASDTAYTFIVGEETLAKLPKDIAAGLRTIATDYSNYTLLSRDPRLIRRNGGAFWSKEDRTQKLPLILHAEREAERANWDIELGDYE